MPKMIQIRDFPDEQHSILKWRAARNGMSLADFIKREMVRMAERPSLREWLDLVGQMNPIQTKRGAAEIIREMRDGQ